MNYDSDIDMLIVFLEVEREVKRALTVEIRRALADMPVPKDIVVTDLNEISRRGDLVGTVLRPALREGKVLYERGAKALLDEEDVAPRLTCFHAQQAAERSIKASLAFLQTQFPRSHDLELLVGLVPEGWRSREDSDELSWLSDWAVEPRYPGDMPEATEEEAEAAVEQAREIYETTLEDLESPGYVPEAGEARDDTPEEENT